MPGGADRFQADVERGFQIIYQLRVGSLHTDIISEVRELTGRVPKRGDLALRCSTSFDHPRVARPGGLCVGHCSRRDRVERPPEFGLSRHSGRGAGKRHGIFQADRTRAVDPFRCAGCVSARPRTRRCAIPDRIWRAHKFIRADALDRGVRRAGSPVPTASRYGRKALSDATTSVTPATSS